MLVKFVRGDAGLLVGATNANGDMLVSQSFSLGRHQQPYQTLRTPSQRPSLSKWSLPLATRPASINSSCQSFGTGSGTPPRDPPQSPPTDQAPEPQGQPIEAYMLAWRKNPLGTLLQHFGGMWAVSVGVKEAVQWDFQATEAASKQSIMAWSGDARVITKGYLGQAFAEATSVQKEELRLLVKSDLDGFEQRVGTMIGEQEVRLDGFEQRVGTMIGEQEVRLGKMDRRLNILVGCFLCTFALQGITLWKISKKK